MGGIIAKINSSANNIHERTLSHVVSQLVETQIARPFRKTETEKTDIYSYLNYVYARVQRVHLLCKYYPSFVPN